MLRLIAVLCLFTLAACGADGPPLPPAKAASKPGLTISGEIAYGIRRTL